MKTKRNFWRSVLVAVVMLILSLGVFAGCGATSDYDIAVEEGYTGSRSEWLETLKGKSAYELAVENGLTTAGSEAEWLASLKVEDITLEELFDFYRSEYPDGTVEDFLSILSAGAGDPVAAAAHKALRSAVSIRATFGGSSAGVSGGAGVIVELDRATGTAYIVTNYHVIYERTARPAISADIQVAPYGKEFFPDSASGLTLSVEAEVVGGSISKDIAVLRATDNLFRDHAVYRAADIADSLDVFVGQAVIAAGNPEGAGLSVTSGILNVDSEFIAMAILDEADGTEVHRVMRVDAAINAGNSGGGLFNLDGELIGIVNAKSVEDDIDNIGYAIPGNVAMGIARNIIEGVYYQSPRNFVRYRIGIETKIAGSFAELIDGAVRIREEVRVASLTIGSPAVASPAAKKLQTGDILLSAQLFKADGAARTPAVEITRSFTLSDYLFQARAGDALELKVLRGATGVTCEIAINESYNTPLSEV